MACLRESDAAGALQYIEGIGKTDDKETLAVLAVCLLRVGRVKDAHESFGRGVALESGTHGYLTHEHVLHYAHECRRAQQWPQFVHWLSVLGETYETLGITDEHYLATRDLPSFSLIVDEALAALDANGPIPEESLWRRIAARVDDEGRRDLKPLFRRCGWQLPGEVA